MRIGRLILCYYFCYIPVTAVVAATAGITASIVATNSNSSVAATAGVTTVVGIIICVLAD